MAVRKVWFIEEIDLPNDQVGHRQTVMEFDSTTGDWIRPDDRLEPGANVAWDNVMTAMSNLNGKDRSWIINPVALMDYCNNKALARQRRRRGRGDNDRTQPNE